MGVSRCKRERDKKVVTLTEQLSSHQSKLPTINDRIAILTTENSFDEDFLSIPELDDLIDAKTEVLGEKRSTLQNINNALDFAKKRIKRLEELDKNRVMVTQKLNQAVMSMKCNLASYMADNEHYAQEQREKLTEQLNKLPIDSSEAVVLQAKLSMYEDLSILQSETTNLNEIREQIAIAMNGNHDDITMERADLFNSILTSNVDCNKKDNENTATDLDRINKFLDETVKGKNIAETEKKYWNKQRKLKLLDIKSIENLIEDSKKELDEMEKEVDRLRVQKNNIDRDIRATENAINVTSKECDRIPCEDHKASYDQDPTKKSASKGQIYDSILGRMRDRHRAYLDQSNDLLRHLNLYTYVNRVNNVRLEEIEDLSKTDIDWNEKNPGKFLERLLDSQIDTDEALKKLWMMRDFAKLDERAVTKILKKYPAIDERYKADLHGDDKEEGLYAKLVRIEKALKEKKAKLRKEYDRYIDWQVGLDLASTDAYRTTVQSEIEYKNKFKLLSGEAKPIKREIIRLIESGLDLDHARRLLSNFRNIQEQQRKIQISGATNKSRKDLYDRMNRKLENDYRLLSKLVSNAIKDSDDSTLKAAVGLDLMTDGGTRFSIPNSSHQGDGTGVSPNDGVTDYEYRQYAGVSDGEVFQRTMEVNLKRPDGKTEKTEITVFSNSQNSTQMAYAKVKSPNCKKNCWRLVGTDDGFPELGENGIPIEFSDGEIFESDFRDRIQNLARSMFSEDGHEGKTEYSDGLQDIERAAERLNIPRVKEEARILLRQTQATEESVRNNTERSKQESRDLNSRADRVISNADTKVPERKRPYASTDRETAANQLAATMADLGLSAIPGIGNAYMLGDLLFQIITNKTIFGMESGSSDKIIAALGIIAPQIKLISKFKKAEPTIKAIQELIKKHGNKSVEEVYKILKKGGEPSIQFLKAIVKYPNILKDLGIKNIARWGKVAANSEKLNISIKEGIERYGKGGVLAISDDRVVNIANKWGISKSGHNQLFEHSSKIMKKGDPKRISGLEKRAGLKPGSLTRVGSDNPDEVAEGINNFNKLSDRIMIEASRNGNVMSKGSKSVFWISGAENSKKGVALIYEGGKVQSIMPSKAGDWRSRL